MIVYRTAEDLEAAIEAGKRRSYTVGLDLGQAADPSAICVLETIETPELNFSAGVPLPVTYKSEHRVVHLERLPLRTPYPAIVDYVQKLMATASLTNAALVIDFTGVGRPVFDVFVGNRMRPIGLTISTAREARETENGWSVGKVELMAAVQARLALGTLKIAAGLAEAKALVAELADFRVMQGAAGAIRMDARQGAHDDLVLALAIALFVAERPKNTWSRVTLRGR